MRMTSILGKPEIAEVTIILGRREYALMMLPKMF
jgi:hypothetical protein